MTSKTSSPTTPLFQQLYIALGEIERMSPEFMMKILRGGNGNDLRKVPSRRNSFSNLTNEELSPPLKRRKSYPFGMPEVRITMIPNDEKS